MIKRPPGAELKPILCPFCLIDHRAQRVWLDNQTLNLICPVHSAVIAVQQLEH